ncbi:MAG TPA: tetratricopeptide repeat protein, partial [Alphaproteobacteria bacterium]|nr:tetratricopeptide repeat protein [Alphaproteobacteria bacterium]
MSWGKAAILAVLFGTIVACTSTSFVDKRSSVSREVIEDNDRGNQYSDEGRYDEAIAAYTAAIKLNANFAPSFHNRAFAFYKLGKLDQAIADEDQALALDPNYPDAYLN